MGYWKMSSFFDNFMGGFAFGMLASNPFFSGMGFGFGFGYGGCCSGFANPFPSIFIGGGYSNSASGLMMPTTFANPGFPTVDFSDVGNSIWDTFTNPDSDYNKQMRDYYKRIYNTKDSDKDTSKPDESKTKDNKTGDDVKSNEKKHHIKRVAKTKASSAPSSSARVNKNEKIQERSQNTDNTTTREFSSVYSSLGITDTRFQKIFEERILKSEGREYVFDIHAMANSGVQQGTYNGYRKQKGLSTRDVKYMTNKEMCEIYYNIYKDCGADKIQNNKMALYVFDVAVNSGSEKAKELYNKSGDNPEKFESLRRSFYKYLATSNPRKYGSSLKGWLNRIENTRNYADSNFTSVA
jgi:hypothetical protein